MKIARNGWLCVGLMFVVALGVARAQKVQTGPEDQAAAPQQPAQQTPPQQQPQQPPPQPEQAGTPQNVKLPPPPPKVIDVRMPGEAGFSIGVTGWLARGSNHLDKGEEATFTGVSALTLADNAHGSFGVDVGVAAGLHNTLKFSYFFVKQSGPVIAPSDLVVFAQTFSAGEPMTTNSNLRDFKFSYEYLTWPYPVERRHFRLKTLWQVQYVSMRAVYDDPIKSATPDSSGNITSYAVEGAKGFFCPTFGLGVHQYVGQHMHLEADFSGFAWPGRWQLVDAEATAGYRMGSFEFRAGGKYFHYRTSPKQDYFYRGNVGGLFVGIRWHSD